MAANTVGTAAITLSNGVVIPQMGLGVYKAEQGSETVNAVRWAIEAGYRHIDTASLYGNEESVGQAVAASGIPREELFITTKVWNDAQGYDSTLRAFEHSLSLLGMKYVDLYLIHWPGGIETIKRNGKKYLDTWRALEKLYADKKVRAIGVSNFEPRHISDILEMCTVAPMLNQVELHPRLTQLEVRAFCQKHHIAVAAWSPLGRGSLLENPTLAAIGARHGKSAAQVIIRWDIQHGIITIPKSVHRERIVQNADVFDFVLSDEEMKTIDDLNDGTRSGSHPDRKEFF